MITISDLISDHDCSTLLRSYEREGLGLRGIFADPGVSEQVLNVLQDWGRPQSHGRQEDSGHSALRI